MLIGRNIIIDGFRTSIRLESEMWDALDEICLREGLTNNNICATIEGVRTGSNRTSAIRSYIVTYFRKSAEQAKKDKANTIKPSGYTDSLTGVTNRLALLPKLEQERQRMKRTSEQCSVAIASMDNIENINSKLGREAGDISLQAIAEYLLNNVRIYDQVFRHRGNEFLIVLPNTSTDKAKRVLDRMRRELARHEISVKGKNKITITASFGIAPLSCEDSLKTIITQASEAMRSAKEQGCNRTRIWECKNKSQEKLLRLLEML